MRHKERTNLALLTVMVLCAAATAKRAEIMVPDLKPAEIKAARTAFAGATYLDRSKSADERARDLVARMTLDEKIAYLGGTGFVTDKVIGETQPIARLGIPKFKMTDATLGSKLTKDAILFPAFIGLAASFNRDLSYAYGKAVAEQCKADGYRILLGPGVNLYRVPNCGRNFEYLGEDPFLTSELTVPYIKGCQGAGVLATVKHLSANNSDYMRKSSNSVIDERTLHEIYFPPFVASIEEADVKAVMASYNLLNGEWAAESRWLITDMLRNTWGFDGMVMTDWWSVYNTEKLMTSGVDIEMPAAKVLAADKVREMLKSGAVTETYLDERIQCSLRPCIEMGLLDMEHKETEMRKKWPEHKRIAEQIARESLVLLKNDKNLLPLDRKKVKNIVLFGANAIETIATGGGAAGFDPGKEFITYEQAIRQAAGDMVKVTHLPKLNRKKLQGADAVVVFLTMVEHESMDRNFVLDEDSRYTLKRITEVNRKVIAVVSLGGGVEMASWIDDVESLVYTWYPGTYGATALAEMLFGDYTPSGKLPISIEKRTEETHYHGNYLKEGTVLSRTFQGFGWKAPVHDVNYAEGIFTGYRWYDSQDIEPLFPFGFGLSYTTFEIGAPELSANVLKNGETLTVQVEVTNSGEREGTEVIQLYVSDLEASVPRPEKELKGFERVTLKAGESRVVKLEINARDLAFWDPETRDWKTEPGRYEIRIGSSSRQIAGKTGFEFIR